MSDPVEAFFEAACQRQIASFDVFDTAIRRSVADPTHVFAMAERELGSACGAKAANGFAQTRVLAEQLARDRGRRDHGYVEVTTSEILAELERLLGSELAREGMALEWEAELAAAHPEPEIQNAYRRLKEREVRTIFVSDFYRSEEQVRTLLTKCGYGGEDPIFVSSEYRKAKWDGSLWTAVCARMLVKTGDIAHIGDNRRVDVEAALNAGVSAFYWPGRTRHGKSQSPVNPAIVPVSILKASNQDPSLAEDDVALTWEKLGRSYGAVIYGAFLRWIADRVTHADHLYFCSRDGQIILKLWQKLIADGRRVPPASYLYVSRRTLNLPRMFELGEETLNLLMSGAERRVVRAYLDRAELFALPAVAERAEACFGSLETPIDTADAFARLRDFFRQSASDLANVAHREKELTESYLSQEGLFAGGHRVILDLGWRGSLQSAIAGLIAERNAPTILSGLYFGLTRDAGVNRGSAGWMEAMIANDFMDPEADFLLRQSTGVLETIHAADHGSVWTYARHNERVIPVFRPNKIERAQFATMISRFQDGAAATLREIFAGRHAVKPEDLTPASARAALIDLCMYPSLKEAETIGRLRHFDGFEHAGEGVRIAAPIEAGSYEGARIVLESPTWIAASLKMWLADRPQLVDVARALARTKSGDEHWISQFGR